MKTAVWLLIYFVVLIWSAIQPKDLPTWALEVAPAIIGLAVLAYTRKSFPLTPLVYVLILIHCTILMVGGHYTYADVPLFDWIKEALHQSRNNYDKVGHFAQGLVPTMIGREILLRKHVLKAGGWLNFIVVCISLAISAFYELIEWGVAVLTGDSATAFLGTQGYVWDTQSDMMYALIGAVVAVVSLRKYHDIQLPELLRRESQRIWKSSGFRKHQTS